MKIAISYPPLSSDRGTAFLSQNRQFQWTNTGNVIYPVIPAYGATLLHQMGHQILWDDAIAQNLSYTQWLDRLNKFRPDIIFIETKTPAIKRHWQIIDQLKLQNSKLKIVLMGDHVTALPHESLQNSLVDCVLTGGDYDFMMANLVGHYSTHQKLEPGFYFRKHNTGKFALKHHQLDQLPFIDRDLTQWQLYAYRNTNYKYTPGTYLMSGRDCWWGRCTFCSWTTIFPGGTFRTFSPHRLLDEIGQNIKNYHVKEIFDDAGTLPTGPWLQEFCHGLIDRGYHHQIKYGCNMRFGALNRAQYQLMGQAGFRFILYGFESANQHTLDRISKNTRLSDVRRDLINAKDAGLEPHITIMIGYPWETARDISRTLEYARHLFRHGLVDSMQATIIVPYPGTPLFEQCQKDGLLLTQDWDQYDMRRNVMRTDLSNDYQKQMVQNLFKGIITPQFLFRKIISIRSFDDIKFLSHYAIKFLKKLQDFS